MKARTPINHTAIWAKLHQHQRSTRFLHMRDLFEADSARFESMHERLGGLLLDYSKNRITAETLQLLVQLAEEAKLQDAIRAMFAGEKINVSEERAALHTALRLPADKKLFVDHQNINEVVQQQLQEALHFAERVIAGSLQAPNGQAFSDIVNIGIGGSDLGAHMAVQALTSYHNHLKLHFVANIDGLDLQKTLKQINPATTLFIIASKSFTTPETLFNANEAKKFLLQQGISEQDLPRHLVAVSANFEAAQNFGVAKEQIFTIAEWVGGRYSVFSSMGLALMLAVGETHFRAFLAGAHAMDQHFLSAPLRHNIPVVLGLIGLWYNTFYEAATHAVIPYEHGLRRLPAFLQQLDMESNGKQTGQFGEHLDFNTGAIVWGEEGVNGQHAFFQLLHQGSRLIPCDVIIALNHHHASENRQMLIANALAQTEALMRGKTLAEAYAELSGLPSKVQDMLAPQKTFSGNRPSNTIILTTLDPYHLGLLIAMYEHKVFVQAAIWGINPFDQWGVEYGKVLAGSIVKSLNGGAISITHDNSTRSLIHYCREHYECST